MHADANWIDRLRDAGERMFDAVGLTHTISFSALIAAAVMLVAILAVKYRLDRIEASQHRIDQAISAATRTDAIKEIRDTLAVSKTAMALMDELREELLTLQFMRGANASVIDRLEEAVTRLDTIQTESQTSRTTTDTLTGVVREVRDMRRAYATTSRKLDRISSDLADQGVGEPAGQQAALASAPKNSSQDLLLEQIAKRALESFDKDSDSPS